MTIFRATQEGWFAVGDREVHLDPAVALDDNYPDDAEVIAVLGPRGLVRPDNIEAATAAPGERRAVSRRTPKSAA